MIGLKILFYIFTILMFLVCLVAFINATSNNRPKEDRQTDLIVGVVVFVLMLVTVRVFGGVLWNVI